MPSVPCSPYAITHFPRRLAIAYSGDMANDLMARNKGTRFVTRVSLVHNNCTDRLAKMLKLTMACKLYMAIRRFR